MNEIEILQQRITKLEKIIDVLVISDRYNFNKKLKLFGGVNLELSINEGTKIGTASTQKIGFYGKTPVVQASAINAPSTPGGTYSQSEAQSAVTAINSIRTALTNLGITA